MGLTSALSTAVFGITYNQRQLDITASNIANADTAGYSKKSVSAQVYFDTTGNVAGITSSEVTRIVNTRIRDSYFGSLADTNYANQIHSYTDRLDDIFATLGDQSGLSARIGEMSASLTSLMNDPGNYTAQNDVIAAADAMAREIQSAYDRVASLRQEADDVLAQQAETVNQLLSDIEDIDAAILDATQANISTADMEDSRDRLVEQLSGYLDISVSVNNDNGLQIQSSNGNTLYADKRAARVNFDPTHALQPGQTGNAVFATNSSGTGFSLTSGADTGSIVALVELRDDILIEAQAQLDEIASSLSLAFSNVDVESTAATVGADSGFDLDIAALQPGNTISLEYTDTAGAAQTVTFVAVEDPSLLPLDNSATANPNDTVFGLDISSGLPATYITNITAALAGTDLIVNNNAGELQILGDSTALPAATSVQSLTANVTPTAHTDQGLGLAIFVDTRDAPELYTGALEGGGQKLGYASGIAVNPDLLADSALLVNYQTTPTANTANDPARAQYLSNALNTQTLFFDPSTGIGSASTPFEGTVIDYVNHTVAFQGNQADDAKTYKESKEALTVNLALRYEESYSVDLDAELAFMVQLENAYAANARVMQTIKELFEELLNIV